MVPAIRVDGLAKRYRLGTGPREVRRTFPEALTIAVRGAAGRLLGRQNPPPAEPADFWALKDVSFEVKPGEVVGVIGRNGAGKSTLLKVLSRIVEPTAGRAEVNGRMGSLVEVGAGFHPELSGRENVYLNGSMLGMSRREIDKKFDEIVAFAEMERFLDTPVKRYSSGMYVRLAFAVAAHLEPEILVVDEVLAVGDAEFQARCLSKMKDVSRSGRTILFVSHNIATVQNLCSRAILMTAGRVVVDGPPSTVIEAYNRTFAGGRGGEVDLAVHPGRTSYSTPTMRRIRVVDDADGKTAFVPVRGTARVEIDFEADRALDVVDFGVTIKDRYQAPVFGVNTYVIPAPPLRAPVRNGRICCRLPYLPLMPGSYRLDLYFGSRGHDFDVVLDAAELTVVPADVFGSGRLPPVECGPVCWSATWEITGQSGAVHGDDRMPETAGD
jgi:lipopolysaccharide transport system ATP-binding protein